MSIMLPSFAMPVFFDLQSSGGASEIHLGHFSHSHGQGSSFHDHFITLVYLNPQLYCTVLVGGFSSSVPSLPSPPRTAAFWVSPPRLGGEQLLFNSKANLARVSSTCLRCPSDSKLKGQNHVGGHAREEGQGTHRERERDAGSLPLRDTHTHAHAHAHAHTRRCRRRRPHTCPRTRSTPTKGLPACPGSRFPYPEGFLSGRKEAGCN